MVISYFLQLKRLKTKMYSLVKKITLTLYSKMLNNDILPYIYPMYSLLKCKRDVFLREDGVILIGKINKARLDIVDM